ncbi:MAG: WbuC family cupin fold metalloprotein [Deltaproteobacteria bacterium]|nr:WbuC family cupin fold metalloprotein [Deltaproteobacteria bacterium]
MRGTFGKLSVRQDRNARSPSFFCVGDVVAVCRKVVEKMVSESKMNGNSDVRISLHNDPAEDIHQMVILQNRKNYYRPHCHEAKDESFHIIGGEAAFFIFDDGGAVREHGILSVEENLLLRIGRKRWHVLIPLSDFVVYAESRPGPFPAGGDSVFAEWAPDGGDADEARNYVESLLKLMP